MSNLDSTEEIDLGQILRWIKGFFKNILVLIFKLTVFLKRKAFILIGIAIVGIIGGTALDRYSSRKDYIQDVIIEPNYSSISYIYDFVSKFDASFTQSNFVRDLGFTDESIENLEGVTIEPVYNYLDILTYHKQMKDESGTHLILKELSENIETNEKHKFQFQYYKIVFRFNSFSKVNEGFSDSFLKLLKTNDYFVKKREVDTQELKFNIEENKKSISFINDYISKISSSKNIANSKDIFIVGNEEEMPTVASLIKEKEVLLEKLTKGKKDLQVRSELFKVVDFGNVIEKSTLVNSKKMLLPIVMLIGFLLFYLLKFIYLKAKFLALK